MSTFILIGVIMLVAKWIHKPNYESIMERKIQEDKMRNKQWIWNGKDWV